MLVPGVDGGRVLAARDDVLWGAKHTDVQVIVVGERRLAGHVPEQAEHRSVRAHPSAVVQKNRAQVLCEIDAIHAGVRVGQEGLDEGPSPGSVETNRDVVRSLGEILIVYPCPVGLNGNCLGREWIPAGVEQGEQDIDIAPAAMGGVSGDVSPLGPGKLADAKGEPRASHRHARCGVPERRYQLHRSETMLRVLLRVKEEALAL
jgi:hypothetical protein